MLPHLPETSPLSRGLVAVPPPPHFRVPLGQIHGVGFGGSRYVPPGRTAAQKAGLRYEQRVQAELAATFKEFLASPTIFFTDDRGTNLCIPDGLFRFGRQVTVVEIKFQHMPEAWWQLRKKYEPVLRAHAEIQEVALLEICRTYDPQTPFPETVNLVDDIGHFLATAKDGEMGVYKWKL